MQPLLLVWKQTNHALAVAYAVLSDWNPLLPDILMAFILNFIQICAQNSP